MEAEEMVIRLPGRSSAPGGIGETTVLRHKEVHHFFFLPFREQPIYSTRAHVFQIDPNTKKNWMPTSKHAVTVSYFYDNTRNVYRIISLDGSKVTYFLFFLLMWIHALWYYWEASIVNAGKHIPYLLCSSQSCEDLVQETHLIVLFKSQKCNVCLMHSVELAGPFCAQEI